MTTLLSSIVNGREPAGRAIGRVEVRGQGEIAVDVTFSTPFTSEPDVTFNSALPYGAPDQPPAAASATMDAWTRDADERYIGCRLLVANGNDARCHLHWTMEGSVT